MTSLCFLRKSLSFLPFFANELTVSESLTLYFFDWLANVIPDSRKPMSFLRTPILILSIGTFCRNAGVSFFLPSHPDSDLWVVTHFRQQVFLKQPGQVYF